MNPTPRENLIRAARRQGFDWVPIDLLLCDSQVHDFRQRFGHDDYFRWFGVDFRWVELKERPGHSNPKDLYPRASSHSNAYLASGPNSHSS